MAKVWLVEGIGEDEDGNVPLPTCWHVPPTAEMLAEAQRLNRRVIEVEATEAERDAETCYNAVSRAGKLVKKQRPPDPRKGVLDRLQAARAAKGADRSEQLLDSVAESLEFLLTRMG
jgi:hypothetical protein